jgi:hypothetical protein
MNAREARALAREIEDEWEWPRHLVSVESVGQGVAVVLVRDPHTRRVRYRIGSRKQYERASLAIALPRMLEAEPDDDDWRLHRGSAPGAIRWE